MWCNGVLFYFCMGMAKMSFVNVEDSCTNMFIFRFICVASTIILLEGIWCVACFDTVCTMYSEWFIAARVCTLFLHPSHGEYHAFNRPVVSTLS